MAAREFGGNPALWQKNRTALLNDGWLEAGDLEWQPDEGTFKPPAGTPAQWTTEKNRAGGKVISEIEELQQLMIDDRDRYMWEIDAQADGVADYFISYLGANAQRHPWTIEYIGCGLAIGNIAYMYYKSKFRRARPSVLCPGLIPPFGPPGHPSFPSGHSFLGHFISLLLLEIPTLRQRYGLFTARGSPCDPVNPNPPGGGGGAPPPNPLAGTGEIKSPMFWLAARLAKNRERLGVHYASDSAASRHLAAGIWRELLHRGGPPPCPTLVAVLNHAIAEWPTKLP